MKISSIDKNNFKGALNNKLILKGLETVANHSATFCASTSLLMSLTLRPLVIKNTPNVEKDNKKYSIANSFSSGIVKFLTTEAIVYPIEKAALNIEKNKDKFLNKESLGFFNNNPKHFGFLSQLLKQGASTLSSIPKSFLSVCLIPVVFDKLLSDNKKQNTIKPKLSFKGKVCNLLSSKISNYFNNEKIQNFANNNIQNSKNITRDLLIVNDVLLTALGAFNIKRNKKIKEKNKNNLIYNNVLSTSFSVVSSFILDKAVQKNSGNFIEKFKEVNKTNPKLNKYLQGINILRPTVIFAFVYYGILPFVSNFLAQKISNTENKNSKN